MPARSRGSRKPRFNQFSVGRAAVLFRRGATREQVVQHYLKNYSEKWGIRSAAIMEKYLFEPSRGMRPNFAKMYENRFPTEIEDSYRDYFMKKVRWDNAKRRAMANLKQDSGHLARRAEGIQKRESDPDFRRKRSEHLASPAFKKIQREAARKEFERRWRDPDIRAQMIGENRKRSSDALKARWGNPEERRQMIKRSRKPRKKKKQ